MRTIQEIYEALKADFFEASGTGITEGGDMSLRLMAVAAEIFSLEAQCEFVKRQAFPQTAEGEYLDRHAQVRAISRRQAAKAGGELRFSLNDAAAEAVEIPAGTECVNGAGAVYITLEDAVIPAGELSCGVGAAAVEAGAGGNCARGSITKMRFAPVGVSSVTNPEPFTGGSDMESDGELRERVLSSYRKLPNGANAAYYEAMALSVAGVEKVTVQPRKRGRGTVDIIFSADSGEPSDELVEKVREMIETCREICVDVRVSPPEVREVEVEATLTLGEGRDFEAVRAKAEEAVRAYFGGDKLGESIYTARIMGILMGIEGVENCRLTSPVGDIAAAEGVLPVLRNLSISREV